MDDMFEKKEPKPPRQPLGFNATAFAVMLGVLCAQEIRGLVAALLHGFM